MFHIDTHDILLCIKFVKKRKKERKIRVSKEKQEERKDKEKREDIDKGKNQTYLAGITNIDCSFLFVTCKHPDLNTSNCKIGYGLRYSILQLVLNSCSSCKIFL